MTDFRASLSRYLRPLSAGATQSWAEGVAGFAPLALAGGVAGGFFGWFLALLGGCCLSWWPAWRLRRIGEAPWWRRLTIGVCRSIALGSALGVIGAVIIALSWRLGGNNHASLSVGVSVAFTYFFARTVILVLAWLRRLVRRRLRWQLMASHAAVIVLLLTMLTAIGSAAGTQLLLYGVHSSPEGMAIDIAQHLHATSGPIPDPAEAQRLFSQVGNGTTQLQGEPPLGKLIQRQLAPTRLLLLSPDGRVIAGMHEHIPVRKHTWVAFYGRSALWNRLRQAALRGKTSEVHFDTVSLHEHGPATIGLAPLKNRQGQTVAVVAVQTTDLGAGVRNIFQATLAIFGLSTMLLIFATALPILALSFFVSYLVARGLARRLEALSSVATAIAGGDLSRRAPIGAPNEIGTLAADVNSMAAHLEESMTELQAARARAEDALRARQELVAGISHELRTPLAIVQAHLEGLLLRSPVSAGGRQPSEIGVPAPTLEALQNETQRLASLVDDLFSLSRAETGALQVHLAPVDAAALVDEVATLMRPLVRQEGHITLSVEAAPGLPPARADADRLRQIIANLVRNAVRHTPEGGIIAISVGAEGGWVVVAVADTGVGISPEHLPHLFERFYRVDQSRGRDSGGAGLGLAIVREFVELMGGKVTAESVVGEGSVFKVYLPR